MLSFIFTIIFSQMTWASSCFVVKKSTTMYAEPHGKTILNIPQDSTVCDSGRKKQGLWIEVSGVKLPSGLLRTAPQPKVDSAEALMAGWVLEQDLKKVTFSDLRKIDLAGAMQVDEVSNPRKHLTIKTKKSCECIEFSEPGHDVSSSNNISLAKDETLGTNCEAYKESVRCSIERVAETTKIHCPLDCVSVEATQKFTEAKREAKFKNYLEELKLKLSKQKNNLIKDLSKLNSNWLPFVLIDHTRDLDYDLHFISKESFYKNKDQELFLFYASYQDAVDRNLSLAIYEKSNLTVRRFPFNLKPDGKDFEGIPFVCMSRPRPTLIAACRSKDEWSPPIGVFDYKDSKPTVIDYSTLEESKRNAGNTCCDGSFIYFQKLE